MCYISSLLLSMCLWRILFLLHIVKEKWHFVGHRNDGIVWTYNGTELIMKAFKRFWIDIKISSIFYFTMDVLCNLCFEDFFCSLFLHFFCQIWKREWVKFHHLVVIPKSFLTHDNTLFIWPLSDQESPIEIFFPEGLSLYSCHE